MSRWVQITMAVPGSAAEPGGAGAASQRRVRLPVQDVIALGRRSGADVELPFASVSLDHALLRLDGDAWTVCDLGSRNGTWVAGERLVAGERRRLEPDQPFRLADIELTLAASDDAGVGCESTTTIARRLVADMFRTMDASQAPRLSVDGDGALSLVLQEAERSYVVGRAEPCDLLLMDESASREHAAFERRWEGVFVRDLGSKNGVLVQGDRIAGERRLRDGQCVTIGDTILCLDDPQDRFLTKMQEQPDAAVTPLPQRSELGVAHDASAVASAAAEAAMTSVPLPPGEVVALTTSPRWLDARVLFALGGVVLAAAAGLLTWLLLAS